jgi:hypothetical protein
MTFEKKEKRMAMEETVVTLLSIPEKQSITPEAGYSCVFSDS